MRAGQSHMAIAGSLDEGIVVLWTTRMEVDMQVAVVGGGTMGVGIGHRFAANGASVTVVDVDRAAAEAAVAKVAGTLRTAIARGKLGEDAGQEAIGLVGSADSIEALPPGMDLIIEAVIEDVALKQDLLRRCENRTPSILASNTSSISIDQLAEVLKRRDRFAGMHFFNPVWAISLVEVVRGRATSEKTMVGIADLVSFLGMEQAVINDAAGFATSRLGVLVGLESIRMVEEGVGRPVDIDTAMRLGYRHPMGPLMLGDLVGLDVRLKIAEHLQSVYGERFSPPALLRSMVADGLLGKKTGRGFYDWSSGSAEPIEE